MNKAVLGVLAGAGLVLAAVGGPDGRSEVFAQRSAAYGQAEQGSGLIAWPTPIGDKGQLLTVIDPNLRVIGVYHIDLATGKIALRSVRNIRWDLQMTYLNNENPLPRDIQLMLEQR